MKMIFVDAENVGLKELEKINASVVDKVFVFSRLCSDYLLLNRKEPVFVKVFWSIHKPEPT